MSTVGARAGRHRRLDLDRDESAKLGAAGTTAGHQALAPLVKRLQRQPLTLSVGLRRDALGLDRRQVRQPEFAALRHARAP